MGVSVEETVVICMRLYDSGCRLAPGLKPGAGNCLRCSYDPANNPRCSGYLASEIHTRAFNTMVAREQIRAQFIEEKAMVA